MKHKLDEFKIRTIFSSLLTLSPIVIGLSIWDRIPNSLLPNSTISTHIDTPAYKLLLVFGIPVILLLVNLICLGITYKDNSKNNQNKKLLNSLFYICPSISIISNVIFYNGILGNSFNPTRIVPFIFGVLFIFCGNNLPKTVPNSTYGIKTYWALKNNENWIKTHRFSGVIFVIGGLICLLLPALPLNYILPLMISVILLSIVLPISYSFFYYKKQVKNGTYIEDGVLPKKYDKKQWVKVVIVVIITLGAILSIMLTGNIDTTLESDAISVDASYYVDIKIPYENVDTAQIIDKRITGTRVAGFGSFKLSLGLFNNEFLDNYTCYTYNSTDNCILIRTTNNEKIVLNADDEELTQELYNEILEKIK